MQWMHQMMTIRSLPLSVPLDPDSAGIVCRRAVPTARNPINLALPTIEDGVHNQNWRLPWNGVCGQAESRYSYCGCSATAGPVRSRPTNRCPRLGRPGWYLSPLTVLAKESDTCRRRVHQRLRVGDIHASGFVEVMEVTRCLAGHAEFFGITRSSSRSGQSHSNCKAAVHGPHIAALRLLAVLPQAGRGYTLPKLRSQYIGPFASDWKPNSAAFKPSPPTPAATSR